MSSHESPENDPDRQPKRRIQRRHGACEPCRSSKTKCDGRMPCGACRSERRRQCPCVYSEKAMKLQQVTAEIRRRAESEKRHCDEAYKAFSDDESRRPINDEGCELSSHKLHNDDLIDLSLTQQGQEQGNVEFEADSARMALPLSVCAAVEEFKKLKPARGYSAQVVSRCNGFAVVENSSTVYHHTESIQSYTTMDIRKASDCSDYSQDVTELQILGSKLEVVDSLIKEGHLTRAWISLASVVREGQLMQDLHGDEHLSPASANWRRLWNKILDLEAQLGLTIGRPTCFLLPRKRHPKTNNDAVLLEDSLDETRTDLYHHIQGMLCLDLSNTTAIRDFLERARDILSHEPFNQIGLCTTEGHSAPVRDLHLSTHLLFMVIFCRMASLCDLFSRDLTNGSWSDTPAADIIRSLNLHQPRQKLAYCRRMFRSANFILDSFSSLHQNNAKQTGRNWIRCHSAYIAAIILGIAKLRHEVEWHGTTEKLRRLEQIFMKLSQSHPGCSLLSAAVERLKDLNSVKEPASESTRLRHSGIKNRKRSAPSSVHTSPKSTENRAIHAPSASSSTSPTLPTKRTIDMVDEPVNGSHILRERFIQDRAHEDDEYQPETSVNTSFGGDYNLSHLSLFEDNSATYSHASSCFTNVSGASSATSFSESEIPIQAIADAFADHPGPPFAYPFPISVLHPPMAWNNGAFTTDNSPAPALPLQMPLMTHYGAGTPSMAHESRQQYNIHNVTTVESSLSDSRQPSPLQPLSDSSFGTSTLSPGPQGEQAFESAASTILRVPESSANGQTFLHQVDPSLRGSNSTNNSRRPTLQSRPSANTVHQPSVTNTNPNTNTITHSAVNVNQDPTEQGQFMSNASIQPPQPSEIIGGQIFPSNQITYINPHTGLFEPTQLHGHYPQSHGPPYIGPYISVAPFQDPWRRPSIDTGNGLNGPY